MTRTPDRVRTILLDAADADSMRIRWALLWPRRNRPSPGSTVLGAAPPRPQFRLRPLLFSPPSPPPPPPPTPTPMPMPMPMPTAQIPVRERVPHVTRRLSTALPPDARDSDASPWSAPWPSRPLRPAPCVLPPPLPRRGTPLPQQAPVPTAGTSRVDHASFRRGPTAPRAGRISQRADAPISVIDHARRTIPIDADRLHPVSVAAPVACGPARTGVCSSGCASRGAPPHSPRPAPVGRARAPPRPR